MDQGTGVARAVCTARWTGLLIWAATVIVAMLLRAVTGQGVQIGFVVVTTVVLTIFLLGWRHRTVRASRPIPPRLTRAMQLKSAYSQGLQGPSGLPIRGSSPVADKVTEKRSLRDRWRPSPTPKEKRADKERPRQRTRLAAESSIGGRASLDIGRVPGLRCGVRASFAGVFPPVSSSPRRAGTVLRDHTCGVRPSS
jgi:hypothetical protein